jgi:hypothetical protein
VEISGVSVFSNCTGLSSVVIPASVTKIGFAAFVGTGITDVEFENPNGWSVYNDYVSPAVTTQLSASDLVDNAIAASYLTTNEAYAGVGRLWTRT